MAKKTDKSKKQKASSQKIMVVGKRKDAKAQAIIVPGSGKIFVNSVPLDVWGTEMFRMRVKEPVAIAGDAAKSANIYVTVRGGGVSGQSDAVRMTVARALVKFLKDDGLKKNFIDYDRNLMVFDARRNEPHKPSRSKAGPRRHKQRSKR
jgi:small subunit ribosomal protein S9